MQSKAQVGGMTPKRDSHILGRILRSDAKLQGMVKSRKCDKFPAQVYVEQQSRLTGESFQDIYVSFLTLCCDISTRSVNMLGVVIQMRRAMAEICNRS